MHQKEATVPVADGFLTAAGILGQLNQAQDLRLGVLLGFREIFITI